MNNRKAKAIRRAAREIAIASGLPMEKKLFGHRGGTAYVMKCLPAVINETKKMINAAPGLPIAVIDEHGANASVRTD